MPSGAPTSMASPRSAARWPPGWRVVPVCWIVVMTSGLRERRKRETRQAEGLIRHLADVIADRAPGESLLAAVRRDYADAVARGDVSLGLSSPAFARMIQDAPALASRALEMLNQREQALGDAIAAETGTDTPQQRVVAALLVSVPRVLSAEAFRRSLAGQPRDEIRAALAEQATAAFDLLEPAVGDYLIRPA